MSFNGPPNYPGPQGAPSPHQQMCAQMRPHFMGGPPGQQHPSFPPGGPNNPNFINNSVAAAAAARFPNYQRMSSHAQQQAAVAAMASSGGSQIPSPGAMQRPQMMGNPMQNVSFFIRKATRKSYGVYSRVHLYRVWDFIRVNQIIMPDIHKLPRMV